MLSVSEFAERVGVSGGRVRELIAAGSLPAVRVGGRWVIEDGDAARWRARSRRPLSAKMAWGLVALSVGVRPVGFAGSELSRLRRYLEVLRVAEDGPEVLRAMLAGRAERRLFNAAAADVAAVREALLVSGISDPRSGLSSGGFAEGYVSVGRADTVVRDFFLVSAGEGDANVFLHVVDGAPVEPVPSLLVAADLAEHGGAREVEAAARLLAEVVG